MINIQEPHIHLGLGEAVENTLDVASPKIQLQVQNSYIEPVGWLPNSKVLHAGVDGCAYSSEAFKQLTKLFATKERTLESNVCRDRLKPVVGEHSIDPSTIPVQRESMRYLCRQRA